MNLNDICNCTKCKKPFGDFKIMITLGVKVQRKKTTDAWENVGNLNINSNEVLCEDCFDKFSELLYVGMKGDSNVHSC